MGPIAGDLECFLTVTPGPMVPTEGLTVCSQGMPEDTVGGGAPTPAFHAAQLQGTARPTPGAGWRRRRCGLLS